MRTRLNRITTKTGDTGQTGLADGSRVSKSSCRIHAIGNVDELNSSLGVLLAEPLPSEVSALLLNIQHQLFCVGSELAMPQAELLTTEMQANIEAHIEHYNSTLSPLVEFILPSGSKQTALAHLCRTVCRRAERSLVELHEATPIRLLLICYLNRLSDLLFILARVLQKAQGLPETYWNSEFLKKHHVE